MSKNILGLDLGTSSIGWALINDENKNIIDTGVIKFEPPVDQDHPLSPAATRRLARSARRSYFRKSLRKRMIKKFFQEHKIISDSFDWSEFSKLNPYELRRKALSEQISLLEFARICYHIGQRRGYKGSQSPGDAESNKIFDGYSSMIGINQTRQEIQDGNFPSPGSYFAHLNNFSEKIRGRFLTRQMFIDEFNQIVNIQKQFHPILNDETFINRLGHPKNGLLFFQRQLKSQKNLVGKCVFEKNKTRMEKSHPEFELYSSLQTINQIRYTDQDDNVFELTQEQREKVLSIFNTTKAFKFSAIMKKLFSKKELEDISFNYPSDTPLAGNTTHIVFSNLFTPEIWNTKTMDEKISIWNIFKTADIEWLVEYAVKKWNFSNEQLSKIPTTYLKQGYASISRNAAHKMIPFLLKGYIYSDAAMLAGVVNCLGNKWNILDEQKREQLIQKIFSLKFQKENVVSTQYEKLKKLMVADFGVSEKELKKLYNHSETERVLNEVMDISSETRNPVVIKALHRVKNLLNILRKKHGSISVVRIEMSREFGASAEQIRNHISVERKNNIIKQKIKEKLELLGVNPKDSNIKKYRLWEECKGVCVYTGKTIGENDLFSGQIDMEHIVPRSISINNSLHNLTLCYREENQEKNNRTPYEAYCSKKDVWVEIKNRAKKVFSTDKYNHFISKEKPTFEESSNSMMNDTRYICTEVKEALKTTIPNVETVPARATQKIRQIWDLEEFIGGDKNGKNRLDNRNHAVDAIVVAYSDLKNIRKVHELIARQNTNLIKKREFIPTPYEQSQFQRDVINSVMNILVCHDNKKRIVTTRTTTVKLKNGITKKQKSHSIRECFHELNFFGKIQIPQTDKTKFAKRKPVESFTTYGSLKKIVDPQVRYSIIEHLKSYGILIEKKEFDKKALSNAFKDPVWLLDKKGNKVRIIKKVRFSEDSNLTQIQPNQNKYVSPGSNAFFVIERENELEKWNLKTVSFFEYIQSYFNKGPKINLKESENRIVLKANDMVVIGLNPNSIMSLNFEVVSECLYRVQKFSNKKLELISHIDAKVNSQKYEMAKTMTISNHDAIVKNQLTKVKIDYDGSISVVAIVDYEYFLK